MRTLGSPTAPRRRLAAAKLGGISLYQGHPSDGDITPGGPAVNPPINSGGGDALSRGRGVP